MRVASSDPCASPCVATRPSMSTRGTAMSQPKMPGSSARTTSGPDMVKVMPGTRARARALRRYHMSARMAPPSTATYLATELHRVAAGPASAEESWYLS